METESDVDSQFSGESDGIPLEQPKPLPPPKPQSTAEMLKTMIKKQMAQGPMGQQILEEEKEKEEQKRLANLPKEKSPPKEYKTA